MSGEFTGELEAAFGELESVTARLGSSDPGEFRRLADLLARRGASIAQVVLGLDEQPGAAASPGTLERLQAARRHGADLEERLKLARAATRHQLQELHRTAFHARAIAWGGREPDPSFELEA